VVSGISNLDEIADYAYADTPDAHPVLKVDQTFSHLKAHERSGAVEQNGGRWLPQG
jgi:hypothetical protein